ncbi:HlyD family efflux transporter periplasmic adaptor subunit [Granulicella sp. 5B5]|uniref:HlyD family secretion protein n=1 Tax=Granulicella sp. 5B5 TaxID=1617967 RepID=UPI0015F3FBA9|nr:HlyD family secretion protein [Granulicella sp. 5B5]QMV17674.1 HlyD family efflux transporter periplasmic adaptor subunit [Granulicella sp. 5B5]
MADTNEQVPQNEAVEPKKSRRPIVIGIIVVIALVALFFYWRSTFTEDTDDAQIDGNLYQVSSRVAGQVIQVNVEEQQLVHKGDVIAQMDPTDYQVALDQAEADLATAQAQYEQASAGVPITSVNVRTQVSTSGSDVSSSEAQVSQAEAQVAAADARIAQARANAQKAQLDVDRYTPLVAKDVISKQQFDQAVAVNDADKAALDEAQRSAKASRDAVNAAKSKLASSVAQSAQSRTNAPKQVAVQEAQAAAAKASIAQAQARVDQAKLNLGYTKIVAPEDGIVSKKSVVVGENLSVGQSLVTIVPLTDLWVTANFKETQLAEMKPGQTVKIEVDALGGRKFTGKVTQIGGATGSSLSLFPPENATGNYVKVVQRIPVRIDFTDLQDENKDEALRIGMSVEPTVRVKQ